MPIFDQGYQHWQGPLSGHGWRWLAIARHGVRVQLKNRLLRFLASTGIFAESTPGTFSQTTLSTFLRSDVYAIFATATGCFNLWRVTRLTLRRRLGLAGADQRAELDAAFFHLYFPSDAQGDWLPADNESPEDLARLKESFPHPRDAVSYIMDTFPIVRRKDIAKHGTYRTKDTILNTYDAMQTMKPRRDVDANVGTGLWIMVVSAAIAMIGSVRLSEDQKID